MDTIFDSGHDLTDFQDLDQLELTHDVLRETLRLYPPAPLLFRQPTEDFDVAGLAVPGGTGVSVSLIIFYVDQWCVKRNASALPARPFALPAAH